VFGGTFHGNLICIALINHRQKSLKIREFGGLLSFIFVL
jgi:hypothetical protein